MHHKLIFIQTHPIQYAAPMFKEISEAGLPLEVWFCEEYPNRNGIDKKFGQRVKWDIPLLDGYKYRFFTNQSWKPSVERGFWGLLNLSILKELKKTPPSLVVVYGWNYATTFLLLLLTKKYGHSLALRGESPLIHEWSKPKWKLFLRKWLLGKWLFKKIDYAFYIGSHNRDFYQYYGVAENKLKFTPYAVDNKRFSAAYKKYSGQKEKLRNELGLHANLKTILFSGKFTEKKRPMDLLLAFHKLNLVNAQLVFLGDGMLRPQMEQYINANQLTNVYITGFINQSEIVKYYATADVFVMCSGFGETWGLSVNEAMNFNLPLVVSDLSGNSIDLVENKNTGYVYPSGDIDKLAACLDKLFNKTNNTNSKKLIDNYSYKQIITTLKSLTQN